MLIGLEVASNAFLEAMVERPPGVDLVSIQVSQTG